VEIQFGWDGSGIAFELLAPIGEASPVAAALKAGRNALQHIAYRTSDFADACEAVRREGALPLGPARPALAFGKARVMFFLTPLRFVCELIEVVEEGVSERGETP
jgi:methylmalonyl-CoA/ethylmalonyl-CoA epimerase